MPAKNVHFCIHFVVKKYKFWCFARGRGHGGATPEKKYFHQGFEFELGLLPEIIFDQWFEVRAEPGSEIIFARFEGRAGKKIN